MPQTQTNEPIPRRNRRRRTSHMSRQEYANKFNGCWRKSVEAIFEASACLIEAKNDLDPHEFEAMLDEDLLVSGSSARKLMLIAQKEVLCAHVHKLPPHWGTLYELTKVEDARLLAAFEADEINPNMERKDAVALKPSRRSRRRSQGDDADDHDDADADDASDPAHHQDLRRLFREAFGEGHHNFRSEGVALLDDNGRRTVAQFNNSAAAKLVAKLINLAMIRLFATD
jgi:hypothetical protein